MAGDDINSNAPNPEFWTALLWRRLMGSRRLAVGQASPLAGDFVPAVSMPSAK
jgi:hypothetical protein